MNQRTPEKNIIAVKCKIQMKKQVHLKIFLYIKLIMNASSINKNKQSIIQLNKISNNNYMITLK